MKIFVFDFDLTLSDEHTGGNPKIGMEYITQPQLRIIMKGFKHIKEDENNLIMILSRTPKKILADYLKNKYPTLFALINELYGPEIEEFNEHQDEGYWANWKVNKLIYIQNRYPQHKLYFFDY